MGLRKPYGQTLQHRGNGERLRNAHDSHRGCFNSVSGTTQGLVAAATSVIFTLRGVCPQEGRYVPHRQARVRLSLSRLNPAGVHVRQEGLSRVS